VKRAALIGPSADEDGPHPVLQQVLGLFLDDRPVQLTSGVERRVPGGDEAGQARGRRHTVLPIAITTFTALAVLFWLSGGHWRRNVHPSGSPAWPESGPGANISCSWWV
jgi:hypothetical protein